MRIVKPMTLGILTRSFEQKPKRYFAVSSLAFFDLADPGALLAEQLMWPYVLETLGKDALFDVGMPKPNAEVVVVGKALAPAGTQVASLDVGIGVRRDGHPVVNRALRAYGDRFWQRDRASRAYLLTPPRPFTEMPIGYDRAFGGEGFERNPVGRGANAQILADHGLPSPLPNIVDPRHEITQIGDHPEPASFMPVDMMWPQRRSLTGTYDESYVKTAFPGLPSDFDWAHYNVAHPEQWLEGFFRGDEAFSVVGMNAAQPLIRSRLPGLRPRCFIRIERDGGPAMRELTMRDETLWLFPNDARAVLVSRGVTRVRKPDADDVDVVMLGYERLSDQPRPREHYAEVMRLRTDPKERHLHMLRESQLTPELDPAEKARREAARLERWKTEMAAMQAGMAGVAADLMDEAKSGLKNPPPPVEMDLGALPFELGPLPLPTEEDIARMDIDLVGLMEGIEKLKQKVDAEMEARKADAGKALEAIKERGASTMPAKEAAEAERQAALARLKVVGPEPIDGLEPHFDLDRLVADAGPEFGAALPAERRAEVADQLRDAHARLRDLRRASPEPVTNAEPAPAPVAAIVGSLVRSAHAEGRSLAERDLADADLRDAAIAGIDLTRAMLERADLRGADLTGALCAGATFCGANLSGADLSGADLSGANLSAADLTEANLSGAILSDAKMHETKAEGTFFERADLRRLEAIEAVFAGARFPEAALHEARFIQCKLPDASFAQAVLEGTLFITADLSNADFLRAALLKARLVGVAAPGARFTGATLDESLFTSGSDLRGATFGHASLRKVGLHGVLMAGSRMMRAVLDGADLGEADLTGADLRRASLVRAVLVGTDLTDARCERASLRGAVLRKAILVRTNLEKANLYQAEFLDAVTDETVVRKANLTGTKMAV